MTQAYDNVTASINEAKALNFAIERNCNALADLLLLNDGAGLRKVSICKLAELKRQLRNFDAGKRRWKP